MRTMTRILAGAAGIAAIAAAAPAAAQYYPQNNYSYPYGSYGYSYPAGTYGYGTNAYGTNAYRTNAYGAYGVNTSMAAQQCTAAVQARLNNRTSLTEILGAALGVNTQSGRVVSITRVNPNRNTVRVRGLASSGRYASNNYGPYGAGAYGALGYGYAQQADLSFKCDVDYRGYVRDVDINRR